MKIVSLNNSTFCVWKLVNNKNSNKKQFCWLDLEPKNQGHSKYKHFPRKQYASTPHKTEQEFA